MSAVDPDPDPARKRLKELREAANMSQGALSQKLGVPIHRIARIENGTAQVDRDLLSEAFDVLETAAESAGGDGDGADGNDGDGGGIETAIPPGYWAGVNAELFHILNADRRRDAVLLLDMLGGETDLGYMARLIAAIENGVSLHDVDSDMRKRVYIAMHQAHVEKMAEAGLIDLDDRTNAVTPTSLVSVLADFVRPLLAIDDPERLANIDRVIDEEDLGSGDDPEHPALPGLCHVPTREQFREMRERAGLTQTEVAERIGVTNYTLSRFETGNGGHKSIRAATLRDAMDVIREETVVDVGDGGDESDG